MADTKHLEPSVDPDPVIALVEQLQAAGADIEERTLADRELRSLLYRAADLLASLGRRIRELEPTGRD